MTYSHKEMKDKKNKLYNYISLQKHKEVWACNHLIHAIIFHFRTLCEKKIYTCEIKVKFNLELYTKYKLQDQ